MDKLAVLIPCYNEGENIVKVVDKLSFNCPQFDYIINDREYFSFSREI
jgi:glycosyltransferase involved in cell wall biosynthesis